jgi:glycosyltransferase involved in cell wall biosynthesis
MNPSVLVIIPAFNEEETIAAVLLGLQKEAPDFDRVVVNDGSKDGTGRIVDDLGEKQLRLPSNLGYGRALQTGLKFSLMRDYDIVVTFDADGQHRPEDVTRLVETLMQSDADVVIGSRFCNGARYTGPFGRRLGQYIFSHLTRLFMGQRIYDTSSGFKAMNSSACATIVSGTFMDFHIEALVRLSLFGFTLMELPITMREREYGRSMHSLISFVEYPVKTLLLTLVAAADALLERRAR